MLIPQELQLSLKNSSNSIHRLFEEFSEQVRRMVNPYSNSRCLQKHWQNLSSTFSIGSLNIPYTHEPEPLMEAYTAPKSYNSSLMAAISGNFKNTLSSKSFCMLSFHVSTGCLITSFKETAGPIQCDILSKTNRPVRRYSLCRLQIPVCFE